MLQVQNLSWIGLSESPLKEAQAEWDQVRAEWIPTGFPGSEPAFPVAKEETARWTRIRDSRAR
jgi:hypothetical protein